MKLISYSAIRPGIQAIGSITVRIGTKSKYSHTEVMFMPGDGVEDLVPDGSLEPIDGAYWCASATASDIMPEWSKRRKGKMGGVRWKRIVPDANKWHVQDLPASLFSARYAANWFNVNEGHAYDWRHILSFLSVLTNWAFGHSQDLYTCTETAAAALGFKEPERFHPGNLPQTIDRIVAGLVELLTPAEQRTVFINA